MVGGTMLGVEMGVRLLVYTKNLGLSGVVLLAASVAVMLGLFIYTQLETQKSHKKIDADRAAGKEIGREVKDEQDAPFLPDASPSCRSSMPNGPPGHFHVGHRDRGHVHRRAGRFPGGRRRLHPRAGPGVRHRHHHVTWRSAPISSRSWSPAATARCGSPWRATWTSWRCSS